MALGLRLVTVLPHDLLESDLETQDFGHDIDTAHDNLVKMSVPHQIWRLQHGKLETCPHSVCVCVCVCVCERERERERGGRRERNKDKVAKGLDNVL